jgi:hypothetical protein
VHYGDERKRAEEEKKIHDEKAKEAQAKIAHLITKGSQVATALSVFD